jgi:hypothetical protein
MGNYSLKVIYMSSGIRDWPEMLWTWPRAQGWRELESDPETGQARHDLSTGAN